MPEISTRSADWRDRTADLLHRSPARAGHRRVLAVEGRSGAGKTALAEALAARLRCPVVHMDDLYPGWEGLEAAAPLVRRWVMEPLTEGRGPRWRRWDWETGDWSPDDPGGWDGAEVADTLVIEGCGCGAKELRPYLSLLVWVEAPPEVRRRRLDSRWDAELYRPYREMWATQEESFAARHAPRDHADLILDNSTESKE
ncbi:nucleoside/nucleotide kinase family protein [Nocardiopsis baichengensis]|uniref:hypothetical protein n=1 Tax=Nocardiopsis baichengensis TaxID=280240 RepID=UPI00034D3EB5|nr:hypothetical protein [Nocardiopsis baichengensis]